MCRDNTGSIPGHGTTFVVGTSSEKYLTPAGGTSDASLIKSLIDVMYFED